MKTSIARKVLAKAISFHSLVMGGVFTSMVGYSAITCAGPTGGNIVGGDGEISTDDKTTRVDQISDVMAINWDTFNLAADEKVLYVQPSASSLVLNRILDDNASVIRGTIDANGHVLLVNPQGVLFTDSATVNVNGIAVSGLDIDPNDFMNGDFKLRAVDGASGSVINYGVINASSAALFGKQIANHGLIKADVVSLVGAGEAVLSFDSDGMIGVQITQSVLEKEAGVDSAVLNAGGIEGRQVLLDASVAKGLFDSAVNNSGTVTARGIDTSGGVIRLTGVGSQVTAGGTLDANGVAGAVYIEGDVTHVTGDVTANNAAGLGGQVHLLGEEVNVVAGAVVSADGSEGGGSVLVGGDYRGAGDVRLAQTTKVEEGAVVSASATADGDGGTVIVWAEDTAVVAGRVSANAAGTTGDGGFVETSGKNIVNLTGEVEALSAGGAAGTWLIDPGYLEIGEGASGENYVNANDLSDTLKNQSVTVISNAGNDFEGVNNAFGIRVTADLIVGGGSDTTLTLIAEGGDANNPAPEEQPAGIVIDADIRRINNKKFSLALVSNKDITITTGHEVDLNGGDLTANSLGSFVNQGHIEAGHVNLSVGQAGDGSSNTLGSVIFSELNITGGAGSDSFDLSSLANLNVDISAASEVMLTQSGQGLGFEGVESATTNGALLSIASSLDSAMIDFSLVPLGNGTAPKASIKSGADQIIELIGLSAISGENLTVSDTTVAGEDAELSISDSVGKKLGHNKLVFKSGSPTPFNLSVNGVVAIAAGRRFTLSAEDDTLNIDDQDTSNADDDIFSTETGIEFGASAFSEIDFGEGYDEVTRSNLTLALTGGHNNIAVGGILFTQVEKVKTNVTSFVGSEDADVVTMSNRKDFTANGIEIDGDNNFTTIDLANGADADAVDVVYGESGHSWTLLADGGARSRDIQFNNVEQVVTDDNNLSVEAGMVNVLVSASSFSDADFGGNSIVVNGLGFQRRNSGGVTDFDAVSVDETSSLLVDGDSFGTVELYDANSGHLRVFSTELENVAGVSGGELITTANTDFNFVITNDNAFTVSGISFTDVSSVTANGADDSSTSDMGWTLLGGANNAESRGVEFSGLERASGASDLLTGSALADMFALHADGTITGNGIAFTGIALVNAGDDVDSVQSHSDTAWTSTGDNSANAVTGGAIAFSQIEFVTDIASGATLFGQVGVGDTASDLTNDSITLNSIVFSNEGNFGALDLAGGGDSLTIASDVTSEVIGDNSVDVSNLVYDISGVDAIIGGQVTTLADSAVVVALDNLGGFELNGIAFSNSVKVTSQHDDSTIVGGDAWSFVGDSTSVIQTFTDMAFERFIGVTTDGNGLSGSNAADSVTVIDVDNVMLNGITFTTTHADHYTAVDLLAGEDVLAAGGSTVTLTGVDGEARVAGVTLANVYEVTDGALVGSASGDTFEVTGNQALKANDIRFSGISSVNADNTSDLAQDDIVTAQAGAVWTLVDVATQQVSTDGITFFGIERAEGDVAELTVSDTTAALIYTDSKTLTAGANLVFASSADFTDLLGSATNSLQGSASTEWTLTDVGVRANNTLDVIGFGEFENGALIGRANVDDSFSYSTASGNVSVAGQTFIALASVTGNGGDDSVSSDADWTVINSNSASTNGRIFSDIDSVTGNGQLTGTSGDDTFTILGSDIRVGSITYEAITAVDGAGGDNDRASAAANISWTLGTSLSSADGATFNGIEFTAIAQAESGSNTLIGSTGADTYSSVVANSITANGIAFGNITTVNTSGNDDTLAAASSDAIALNGAGVVSQAGVSFVGLRNVAGGQLTTDSDTSFDFVITNDNAFTVSGISFSEVSSVTANGADDSATSDMGWTLLGGANNAESRGVEFSGLERASGASDLLTGSALADTFALHANGTITGNGIAFTGIAVVNAGDDVDSVQSHSDTVWTSTGDNSANAVTGGAIAFSQIESVTDIASGATLFGQVGVGDTASDLTNDSITLNSIVFSNEGNFGALDLAGGGDSLTMASDVTSEIIGDNSVDVSNLVYDISGVDAISGGQVTTLADSAVVVALDNLGGFELNGIAFSNSVKVTSQHDDSTIVGGDAWSFVGDSTSVIQTFTDMAFERFIGVTTDGNGLSGSNAADSVTVIDVDNVMLNGITFTTTHADHYTAVDLLAGEDVLAAGGSTVTLTGVDGEARVAGVTLANVYEVTDGALVGSASGDTFEVTGNQALKANDIRFSGISSVNADNTSDLAQDDIVTAQAGAVWTLVDVATQQVSTDGITFFGIERAEGDVAELTVSDTAAALIYTDSKTLTAGANLVFASSADFTDLLGSATNSLQGSASTEWTLTDVGVRANNTLDVIGFGEFENGELIGRANVDDSFSYSAATGNVSVAGQTFIALASVTGNGGDDSVSSDADWTVINSNSASTNGRIFSDIDSVTGNGQLTGTSGDDTFTILGSDIRVGSVTYEAITAVDGAGGDNDRASAAANIRWTLGTSLSSADGATFNGIEFTAIAQAESGSNTLIGSTGADTYSSVATNSVTANGIAFGNITTVNTSGNDDTLAAASSDAIALNGAGVVSQAGVSFVGLRNVAGGQLTTDSDTSFDFVITNDNAFTVSGISFSEVSSVTANGADDSATSDMGWTLLGGANNAESRGVEFSGLERASGASDLLTGSALADNFELLADGTISGNGILFNGIVGVNAGAGNDSAVGRSGVSWAVNGLNSAVNGGVVFNGIDALTGDSQSLLVTTGDDELQVTGLGSVNVWGMDITSTTGDGLTLVDMSTGVDTVRARAGEDFELLAGGLGVRTDGIDFINVENADNGGIYSGDSDGVFEIIGTKRIRSGEIYFNNVEEFNAEGGYDVIIGYAGEAWQILSENSAKNYEIVFINIEEIRSSSDQIYGSTGADDFVFINGSQLQVAGMEVLFTAGLSSIDGVAGEDSFQGLSGTHYLLNEDYSAVSADGIDLLNINDLQLGSSLTGRAATDEFSVSNSGQVAVAGYTFSALDSVAGNGGSDSVIFSDANTVSVDSTGAVTYTTSKDLLFSGMQAYTGSIDTLVLGADVANVDISTVGQLSLAGVTFDSSSSAPLALNVGSTATLLNYGAAPITISDVSGQIESAGVVANGVGRADANFVQGEGVVSLTVTGSGTLEAAGIDFTSVASYDGSSSSDDVFGGDIALVGSAGQLAFEGIEFTAIEQATTTTGQVFGSNQSDVVIFSADGSITANGISLTSTAASGFSTVELGDGLDRVTVSNGSASLTGNDNEFYVGSVFVSDVDIATSAAIESSVDVAFDYLSTQSLRAQNIVFDGLSSVTTNNAEGSLAGAGHIQENIDGSLTAGSMNFVGLDFVQANSLQLSSADNVIDVDASGNVTASAVRFSGLSALNTGGGTDRIHATSTNSWSISDDAHDVSLGSLGISGAEVLSGVTTLESSSAGQRVTVTGAGEVNIGAMSIRDLVEVSATGSGSIVQERQGTVWQLKDALSQVVSDSIAFSGFSEFLADDSTLVADGAAAETFAVNSDGSQLAAGNVVFGGVTQLNGQANDQLRVADNTAIALTGQSAVVTINELKSQGIKQITGEGIAIIGTAAVDNVALESGANNIYADGIHFEGVTQFDAGGGSDQLSGDNASRSYVLDSAAQVSVAGITFKGIETVNALGAEDVVSSSGADWYAQAQGGALTSKASQAVVGDVSVLFTGIETIEGVGSLYGADVGSHYQLTDLNSLVYGDITYKNVSQLVAGAANDTLRAGDTSTNWSLQAAGNTAVSGSQTLAFSGFESLQLGSGADTVVFGGGSVNRIDTGAGSDNVKLIGGSLGSLHLGAGNDHLVVVNNALAPASFFGGAGEDSLLSESGLAWSLIATDANNGLGDYRFTGFETLLDSGAAVQVATQTSNYLNGKTLASGGMSLSFDSANSLDLTAGALGAESVTGNLAIDSLVLAAAGDVNLGVTANNLSVTNLSDAIDVQLAIQGDATVKSINAGNGDILLTSSQAGSLYFEAGQENLTASNVQLGTEAQPFIAIGDELNPAVIRASDSVKFVSLSYVEPLYVGFIPTVTSFAGNRIESVYGAQAAQGVKSAVQTAVEDFAQVDPAIFEAVSPYSTSANALGGGEFRLVAGVLLPADATAAGNDEELEDNAEREQAPTQLIELPEDAVKPELKEGFESTYQIKKGDTFWDIAEKFLKNPYKWQDLWKQNPNVKNPHKIFPGDVIKVILIRGNAYLTIQAAPQSEDALCTAGWPMRAVAWVPMVTNNERS